MFSRFSILHVIAWIAITFLAFAATAMFLEGRLVERPLLQDDLLELRTAGEGGPGIVYRPADTVDGDRAGESRASVLPLKSLPKGKSLASADLTFHRNPALLTWLVFVAGMIALGVALVPLLSWVMYSLRRSVMSRGKRMLRSRYVLMAACVIAVLFVMIPLHYSTEFNGLIPIVEWFVLIGIGLSDPDWTVRLMQVMASVPGIVALFGMFLAGWTADDLEREVASIKYPRCRMGSTIQRFRDVKFALRLCLASTSVLLVMTILTTGALREALLTALSHEHPWIAPIEFLYLYGLLFAVVLAIVYLPIHFHIRLTGKRIFEMLKEDRGRGADDGETEGKSAADTGGLAVAEEVLTGQESVANKLVGWLSIAAPAIGTVLPDLISL